MIRKLLVLINTIHQSSINHESGIYLELINQKEILVHKNLSIVKTILSELKKTREKELEIFTKTFQDIVRMYEIKESNFSFLSLPPTLVPHEHFGILNTASNLRFQVQSYILKKLFFSDLLFYYYDVCYRMSLEFSEKVVTCQSKLNEISWMLDEVLNVKKITNEELNLDFLLELASGTFNIYEFSEKLETIVCKSWGIKKDQIRQILYTDFNLNIDINVYNIEEIYRPYKLINHFIKCYNTSMTKDEKSYWQSQSTTCISKRDSLLNFENKYLNCLTLNITREYQKRLQSPEDSRFKTYKKFDYIINSCEDCKNYCKDMLRNVRCVSHKIILDRIRIDYFRFFDDSWIVDSILNRFDIFMEVFILTLKLRKQAIIIIG